MKERFHSKPIKEKLLSNKGKIIVKEVPFRKPIKEKLLLKRLPLLKRSVKLNVLHLMKFGIHIGDINLTTKCKSFISGRRDHDYSIIDLNGTIMSLRGVIFFIRKILLRKAKISVSGRNHNLITKLENNPFIFKKATPNWLGGFLTNRSKFTKKYFLRVLDKARCSSVLKRHLKTLFPGFKSRYKSIFFKNIKKTSKFSQGLSKPLRAIGDRPRKRIRRIRLLYPSALFLLGNNMTPLIESTNLKIPSISLLDMKDDPTISNYNVPSNYRSHLSLSFYYKLISNLK